jgi:hypothetical protein
MKIKIYSTLLLLLLTWFANAQSVPTPSARPGPPPPPGAPIDGGILLLFVTGVIYGVKKLKE